MSDLMLDHITDGPQTPEDVPADYIEEPEYDKYDDDDWGADDD